MMNFIRPLKEAGAAWILTLVRNKVDQKRPITVRDGGSSAAVVSQTMVALGGQDDRHGVVKSISEESGAVVNPTCDRWD